jgi:hypothetical protein
MYSVIKVDTEDGWEHANGKNVKEVPFIIGYDQSGNEIFWFQPEGGAQKVVKKLNELLSNARVPQ